MSNIKIFSGNATTKLAQKIANYLHISLCNATISRFSDGEINVQINENIEGNDVFIIQSTCKPTNDNIMELIIAIDALKRSSAGRITAVIPYFGYSRQDRRTFSSKVPITAKIIADFLSNIGINQILTIDLHSEQIQGFFNIPVDNIFGSIVFLEDILQKKLHKPIFISPDIGGIMRVCTIAKLFNDTDIAIINKHRKYDNTSKIIHIIGNVIHKDCILIDDMIDTGETLCKAAKALKDKGANKIFAYATHPVFSGNAYENIKNSVIDEIVVCDTIPLNKNIKKLKKIRLLTISKILAESIRHISNKESISEIFKNINLNKKTCYNANT